MVDNDESGMVNALNRYLDNKKVNGIAYRRKQHRFTSQFVDILVDTASDSVPDLAFEHKSFKTSSSNKLYFSQHFSTDTDDGFLSASHQVKRVEEFMELSGRDTFLAVEVNRGRGRSKQLFILNWGTVVDRFEEWKRSGEKAGFSPEWLKNNALQVNREGTQWIIPGFLFAKNTSLQEYLDL